MRIVVGWRKLMSIGWCELGISVLFEEGMSVDERFSVELRVILVES